MRFATRRLFFGIHKEAEFSARRCGPGTRGEAVAPENRTALMQDQTDSRIRDFIQKSTNAPAKAVSGKGFSCAVLSFRPIILLIALKRVTAANFGLLGPGGGEGITREILSISHGTMVIRVPRPIRDFGSR